MSAPDSLILDILRAAGYFAQTEDDGAGIGELARDYGLEAALFHAASGRAVPLDAEDLSEDGAGIGIQQIRVLLSRSGIAFDAADSETYDEQSRTMRLSIDGIDQVLFDWSFNTQTLPEDLACLACEPGVRNFLWKSRGQGLQIDVRPCEHGSPGVDLHLRCAGGSRFLAHWGIGFDDQRVLFSVNFFAIVNRLLAQKDSALRLYAWQPFTNQQTGVLLDGVLFEHLDALGLATQLRRIDAIE